MINHESVTSVAGLGPGGEGNPSACSSQTAVPDGGFSKDEFESPALWPALGAQISGWSLIGLPIPEDETHHQGPPRRWGKRPPLQFPLLGKKKKRTPPSPPQYTPLAVRRDSAGSPVERPRSPPPGRREHPEERTGVAREADPAPPRTGHARQPEAPSRKPSRQLRSGRGSGGGLPAGQERGRAGPGGLLVPGSLALGRESAIGAEPARRPAPDFVPLRGAPRRVEKNPGGGGDSRASESRGGGGGPASGSREAGSDPSLAGPA